MKEFLTGFTKGSIGAFFPISEESIVLTESDGKRILEMELPWPLFMASSDGQYMLTGTFLRDLLGQKYAEAVGSLEVGDVVVLRFTEICGETPSKTVAEKTFQVSRVSRCEEAKDEENTIVILKAML